MLKLHVLASGSKGNAAIVENAATGAGALIDCGICKRDSSNAATKRASTPRGSKPYSSPMNTGTTPKAWAWCCAAWPNSVARQWYT